MPDTAAALALAAPIIDPTTILASLDEDQAMILLNTQDGSALINAGAGSGKTRLVVSEIAYEIATGKYNPSQIMAITFTNRAAREMKERLAGMLGEDMVRGMEFVGTFHSVCIKLLRKFGKEDIGWATFHLIDDDDQKKMMRAAALALKLSTKETDMATAKRFISLWKNRMVPPKAIMESAQQEKDQIKFQQGQLFEKYMEVCRKSRAMDFDDVMLYTVWALRKNKSMQQFCHEQFKRLYIDEFQDTNNIQIELVKRMRGADCTVVGVGKLDHCPR